jgi:hypothetical protein
MMKYLLLIIGLGVTTFNTFCQSTPTRTTRYSISAGIGFVHYFNTLRIGADVVDENSLGFNGLIMWEPEHRLALGFESGYYTFYSASRITPSGSTARVSLAAVPILLTIRMRVYKNFFVSTGTGVTILTSEANVLGSLAENSQTSFATFQATALYLKPIGKHFKIGGEFKYLNVAKTEDSVMALNALVAYQF